MFPLLEITNLGIAFEKRLGNTAVKSSSFTIKKGRMVAIVGESGSGKSVTALSILQLLPANTQISGNIFFSEDGNQRQDLLTLPNKEISSIRGNRISMIFQEPMTSLNPLFTCGNQVMEAILQHKNVSKKTARMETIELFRQVSLPTPEAMLKRFPHELSGGQKQRVMIAMAMSCRPQLLIADEPTTALDAGVQKNILLLIKKLQLENKVGVLLITHDLALVSDLADDIIVMYKGEIVEAGDARKILENPGHSYTRALLACRPSTNSKGKKLPVIRDFMSPDTDQRICATIESKPLLPIESKPVLSVQNLSVIYPSAKNFFGRATAFTPAVDDVSFDVTKNETVGLVGESGCGKTTVGRAILQLVKANAGKILLDGTDLSKANRSDLRSIRKNLQIVFQDPYGSLNPRLSIGDAIMEPMIVHKMFGNSKQQKDHSVELLEKVNLTADMFNRYPHQFSGGQRQRICIARALALNPSFLIFDESVSALDVSVQAQVLNLINDLKRELNFTSIFISHDLSVVHYISDRILVMSKGRIIEEGKSDQVFFHPRDPYTQQLIDAMPGKKTI